MKKNAALVKKGQYDDPQTPLAILSKIFNKLTFELYYLFDTEFIPYKEYTLENQKKRYKYIAPYFCTTEGIEKLEPGKKYIIDYSNDLITKELSRKERRKMKLKQK